jgi:hypothetical protein
VRRVGRLLADVRWLHPRPVTTVAVLVVAALSALVARALLPERWRPDGAGWLLLSVLVAYVALRLGAHTGWSKRFKHSVLDWFGGDVDDAQTWLLAGLAAAGVLVLVAMVQRAVGG